MSGCPEIFPAQLKVDMRARLRTDHVRQRLPQPALRRILRSGASSATPTPVMEKISTERRARSRTVGPNACHALDKRAALVTGAASGIGRAAALAPRAPLRRRITTAAARKGQGGRRGSRPQRVRRAALPCDVADEAGVRAMLKAVGDQFRRLDVLINNAGRPPRSNPRFRRVDGRIGTAFCGQRQGLVPRHTSRSVMLRASKLHRQCREHTSAFGRGRSRCLRGEQGCGSQSDQDARVTTWVGNPSEAVAPGWMEGGNWMQRMLKDNTRAHGAPCQADALEALCHAEDVAET